MKILVREDRSNIYQGYCCCPDMCLIGKDLDEGNHYD